MKFLANENFPHASVLLLRNSGYDITSIGENNPSIDDFEVMQIAINESRTIITFDRDYGELIFKHGYRPLSGVIYLRYSEYSPTDPAQFLIHFLNRQIPFEGLFTVLDNSGIRQRKI